MRNPLALPGAVSAASPLARGATFVTPPPREPQTTFFTGTADDDAFGGTGGNDDFFMVQGGADTVLGREGDDEFFFGDSFEAPDAIFGGRGIDILHLDGGSYAAGFALGKSMLQGVERITLTEGDYDLVTDNDLIGEGETLEFIGDTIDRDHHLLFDGSAETDGSFTVYGGYGDDILIGGAGNDQLYGSQPFNGLDQHGGKDRLFGGGGDDAVRFGADFDSGDSAEGGLGYDVIGIDAHLQGRIYVGEGVSGFEIFHVQGAHEAHTYDVTVYDTLVASGGVLVVDALSMDSPDDGLVFRGRRELDGAFDFIGGMGADTFIGGQGDDVLEGWLGSDTLMGQGGADTFHYEFAQHSTGAGFDTIVKFDAQADGFTVAREITGVDATVRVGALSLATFDADLARAIGPAEMAARHAVLFRPDGGEFAGGVFLVIDLNGNDGYQAGGDLVIMLDRASHLAGFGIGNF
jgi:Ca2+-binding RTX toxin-like protein